MSIDLLNCDLLTYLLDFLTDYELFEIESVNKKWQKCVRKLLTRRIAEFPRTLLFELAFERILSNYPEDFEEIFVIDDINIHIAKSILSRCQNVKYLNFGYSTIISTFENNLLIELAKLCPKGLYKVSDEKGLENLGHVTHMI